MLKSSFSALLAVGILLLGSAMAQAPAAPPSTPPAQAQPSATTQGDQNLPTDKAKISYAIGMNVGRGLHHDNIDIDPDLLLRGLKDALAAGQTLMTDEQAQAVIVQLQNQLRQKMEAQRAEAAQANKKAGDDFLAANKTKPGVIALTSGLQYKILKEGTGPRPIAGDTVKCNYRGTFIDGKEFDSSEKHGGPATFPVTGVIKGWTEALQLMPVGSKWQLFLPSDLAYGARGAGADIGPNEALIFEVELLGIEPKDKDAGQKPAATPAPGNTAGNSPSGMASGCLHKSATGHGYTLTDAKHPRGVHVQTKEDLSAGVGHLVTLEGNWGMYPASSSGGTTTVGAGGQVSTHNMIQEFVASKLTHVGDACSAPKPAGGSGKAANAGPK